MRAPKGSGLFWIFAREMATASHAQAAARSSCGRTCSSLPRPIPSSHLLLDTNFAMEWLHKRLYIKNSTEK